MITYDPLRRTKTTYNGWRRLKTTFRSVEGLFGPPSQPKNLKIRPRACLFIAHLMVMLPDVEISLKSKKLMENWNFKNRFFWKSKISSGSMPRCIFWRFPPPEQPQNTPKTRFFKNYDFYGFYDFYIKKAPPWGPCRR